MPIRCLLQAEETDTKFQFENELGEKLTTGEIVEHAYRWKPTNGILTFKIMSYSGDIAKENQINAVSVAVRCIGLETKNLKFKRIYGMEKADINIEFTHNDPLFYIGSNTLAYAWLFTPNSPMNGILKINDNFDWRLYGELFVDPTKNPANPTQKYKSQYLLQVLIHELLHILGYRHDEHNDKSVLWPYANGVIDFLQDAGRMLFRLHRDYERRIVREEIREYFRRRVLEKWDFD